VEVIRLLAIKLVDAKVQFLEQIVSNLQTPSIAVAHFNQLLSGYFICSQTYSNDIVRWFNLGRKNSKAKRILLTKNFM